MKFQIGAGWALKFFLATGPALWILMVGGTTISLSPGTLCKDPGPHARIPDIKLELVAGGFHQPVWVSGSGDGSGTLYIVEQAGVIRMLKPGAPGPGSVFLDIRDRVTSGGEMGLLGLAFHPNYPRSPFIYVNYTRRDRGLNSRISEFRVDGGLVSADPSSERLLLQFPQPAPNHNGGEVIFGPDGYLYIGTGDGGSANDPWNSAQNLGTLLGKILRIDVSRKDRWAEYAIPPDNPFVNQPDKKGEIYAYGLRNPWRFSFDRANGRLFVGDVGQNAREEIDIVRRGKNYGWRIMEGSICTPGINPHCDPQGLELPILDYPRDQGISVTGGYVYRGQRQPDLCGVYFYGDFGSTRIWGLRYDGRRVTVHRELLRAGFPISSFGEDDMGELYVVNYGGQVLRILAE
ncbi:MAG: PQQ-dependent sugar dehydrogenase [bacterium JZ-2024 1]